jgi:hypothetical protein
VILLRNQRPVARLVPEAPQQDALSVFGDLYRTPDDEAADADGGARQFDLVTGFWPRRKRSPVTWRIRTSWGPLSPIARSRHISSTGCKISLLSAMRQARCYAGRRTSGTVSPRLVSPTWPCSVWADGKRWSRSLSCCTTHERHGSRLRLRTWAPLLERRHGPSRIGRQGQDADDPGRQLAPQAEDPGRDRDGDEARGARCGSRTRLPPGGAS